MDFGYAELVYGLTFGVWDYLGCENCKKKQHFCLKVVMSVFGVGLVKFFGCLNYGHKLHLVVTLCFLHMSGVCHFLNFEDIFMNSWVINSYVDQKRVRRKFPKWLKMTIFTHFREEYIIFHLLERHTIWFLVRGVQKRG